MVEQVLSYFLKNLLGKYVEDGNEFGDKIQLGVWSGQIVLDNLILKNSILDLLDAPISLNHGYIGHFELKIPWSKLGIDPITIVIEKVYMIFEPKYQWKPGAAEQREQALKQAKLATAELFATKRYKMTNSSNYGNAALNWFLASFLNKVLDNIQIKIKEVHIRYEDQQSCPSSFCFGLSFESLIVKSRDKSFTNDNQVSPIQRSSLEYNDPEREIETGGSEVFHKTVQLNHLIFYWNPLVESGLDVCSCSFIGRTRREMNSFMSRTVAKSSHQFTDMPKHHYILFPMDIEAFIDLAFRPSSGIAKLNTKLFISDLSMSLEDRQLREIISIATNMSNFSKLEKFSEIRPKVDVKKDPKSWFRYAVQAVIIQLRIDRKNSLNFRNFNQRIEDKMVYIELWKRKLLSPQAIQNQVDSFNETTSSLNRKTSSIYREILTYVRKSKKDSNNSNILPHHTGSSNSRFRITLDSQEIQQGSPMRSKRNSFETSNYISKNLNNETIKLLKQLERELSFEDIILFRSFAENSLSKDPTPQSILGGILSWVTGGDSTYVPEDQKRKLFDALRYDPDRVFRGGQEAIDPNEVMSIVSVSLKKGSITLALSAPELTSTFQQSVPFLKFNLDEFKTKTIVMGDGSHLRINMSLQNFEAFEILPSSSNISRYQEVESKKKIISRRLFSSLNTSRSESFDRASLYSNNSSYYDGGTFKKKNINLLPPLITIEIEVSPLNKDKEVEVKLEVEELEIWIAPSARWTDAFSTFVSWPEDLKYWSEMEMTALNQLADIKSRIDAKLEYMMNNHSNVAIEARINAPIVIITDMVSQNEKSDVLVIDLGLLNLTTEKLAKAERQHNMDIMSNAGYYSDMTITPLMGESSRFSSKKIQGEVLNFDDEPTPPPSLEKMTSSQEEKQQSSKFGNNNSWEVLDSDSRYEDTREMSIVDSVSKKDSKDSLKDLSSGMIQEKFSKNKLLQRYKVDAPNYASTVGTGTLEFEAEDDDLFDVFHCQITHIEVYLIGATKLNESDSIDFDNNKTVIVDKFEIAVDIQVSVLPWDMTIPPVKFNIDIPEINLLLSEPKIVRLTQFANSLINGSKNVINMNISKINKLTNAIKSRSSLDGSRLRSNSIDSVSVSRLSMSIPTEGRRSLSNLERGRLSPRRIKEKANTVRSSFRESISDVLSLKSTYSRDYDQQSQVNYHLKKIVAGSYVVGSDSNEEDEDNDDDSFFSADEEMSTKEQSKQKENLQAMISQRESLKIKLMSDIRTTENDPTKTKLHDVLKQELETCEAELHQLRSSYVDLLMRTDGLMDYEPDYSSDQDEKRNRLEELLEQPPESHRKSDVGRKRNLIHASVFKVPPTPSKKKFFENIRFMNKELLFADINIVAVNIDLECKSNEKLLRKLKKSKSNRHLNSQDSSKGKKNFSLYSDDVLMTRLRLSGIGFKLRHRTFDTKMRFNLGEIELGSIVLLKRHEMKYYEKNNNLTPIFTSDPTAGNCLSVPYSNKLIANGSNSFFKMKYEINYPIYFGDDQGQEEDDDQAKELQSKHNARVVLGYLGLNFDQSKIAILAATITSISEKCQIHLNKQDEEEPDSSMALNNQKSSFNNDTEFEESLGPENIVTSIKRLPSFSLVLKTECISLSIHKNNELMSNAILWSIVCSLENKSNYLHTSFKLADFAINYYKDYNISRFGKGSNIFSRTNNAQSKGSIIARDINTFTPFISLSGEFIYDIYDRKTPQFNLDVKTTNIVINIESKFLVDLFIEYKYGAFKEFLEEHNMLTGATTLASEMTASPPTNDKDNCFTLDQAFNPILDLCNGSANIDLGSISICYPYNIETYSDKIMLRVSKIQSELTWGDSVSFGGFINNTIVRNIGLKISDFTLIDDFHFILSCKLLPANSFTFNFNDLDKPCSLLEKEPFLPIELPQIRQNEIQISSCVSPLVLHINQDILRQLDIVAHYIQGLLNEVSILFEREKVPTSHTNADVQSFDPFLAKIRTEMNPNSNALFPKIGFELNCALKLFQISVVLEKKAFFKPPMLNSEAKEETIATPNSSKSRDFTNDENKVCELLISEITMAIGNHESDNNDTVSKEAYSSAYQDNFSPIEQELYLSGSFSISNIEILSYPHDHPVVRLLSKQDIKDQDSEFDPLEQFLQSNFELSIDKSLTLAVDINELNLLHSPHSIISIIDQIDKFLDKETQSTFNFSSKDLEPTHFDSNKVATIFAALRSQLFRPKSIPMSSDSKFEPNSWNFLPSQSSFSTTETSNTSTPLLFLSNISFSIDPHIKSFKINIKLRKAHIWIPKSLLNPDDLEPILHSSMQVLSTVEYQDNFVQKDPLIGSSATKSNKILSSLIQCNSIQASLVNQVPMEVYLDVRDVPVDSYKSLFKSKHLVQPFSIQTSYQMTFAIQQSKDAASSLYLNDLEKFPLSNSLTFEILHKVHIDVDHIFIQCFLDFRPYLEIYEFAFEPLLTFLQEVQNRANGHPSALDEDPSFMEFNASADDSFELDNSIENEVKDNIASVLDFFSLLNHLATLSKVDLKCEFGDILVHVINDIHQQSMTIAQLRISNLSLETDIYPSNCEFHIIDTNQLSRESLESSKPFAQKLDEKNQTQLANDNFSLISSNYLSSMPQQLLHKFKIFHTHNENGPIVESYKPQLNTRVTGKVCVDYYNQKLLCTEPFIEPFDFSVNFNMLQSNSNEKGIALFFQTGPQLHLERSIIQHRDYEDQELMKNSINNTLDQPSSSNDIIPELNEILNIISTQAKYSILKGKEKRRNPNQNLSVPPPPSLCIDISNGFDINITLPFIEMIFLTLKAFEVIKSDNKVLIKDEEKSLSFLEIRNDTGVLLDYWTSDGKVVEVPRNFQVPIYIDLYDSQSAPLDSNEHYISVGLRKDAEHYYHVIRDIPLEGIGCRVLSLSDHQEDEEGLVPSQAASKNSLHRNPRSFESLVTNLPSKAPITYSSFKRRTPNVSKETPGVVLELISKSGIKTLLLRSTIRIFNSTPISFKVQIAKANDRISTLWETILLPNHGTPFPFYLCGLYNGRILFIPMVNQNYNKLAEAPFPESLKNIQSDVYSLDNDNDQLDHEAIANRGDSYPSNNIQWRRKMTQKRGSPDILQYSHWLNFCGDTKSNASDFEDDYISYLQHESNHMFCNVSVTSKGIPHGTRLISPESSMLTTLNISSPVKVVNLLASKIEILLLPSSTSLYFESAEDVIRQKKAHDFGSHLILSSGEAHDCLCFHPKEKISLAFKFHYERHGMPQQWSQILSIPECNSQSDDKYTYSFPILFKNKSTLTIQLEVVDKGGNRIINFFVPYWVVTSSFLSLQYQHETGFSHSSKEKYLNGMDGLAADQVFEDPLIDSSIDKNNQKKSHQNISLPRGIGKSLGANGIILGPEHPIVGLSSNAGAVSDRSMKPISLFSNYTMISHDTSRKERIESPKEPLLSQKSRSPTPDPYPSPVSLSNSNSPLRLMHCSFSYPDRQIGKLRLKSKGSQWSHSFSLDSIGYKDIELKSKFQNEIIYKKNIPLLSLNDENNHFSLRVWTKQADPPFHRTKIVFILDKYILLNKTGQYVEVRQTGTENVFPLRTEDQVPFWWRPGSHMIQIRLAIYGWSWSGKFSIDKEGDVPIRLKNDFDNTVFFLLIQVVKHGPKVFIVINSGEQYSPYRFENYTLDTFRIKQKGQSQGTNLLPYHSSPYAWDEPLDGHVFMVDVLKNSMKSQDDWTNIGTYTFEKIQTIENRSFPNFIFRIIASGPTKVFQIYDRRARKSPIQGLLSSSLTPSFLQSQDTSMAIASSSFTHGQASFNLALSIRKLGISLVDSTPEELLYVSINGVQLDLMDQNRLCTYGITVERIQIDNQLWTTPYPSLFHPLLPLKDTGISNQEASNFISLNIVRDFSYPGIEYITLFKLSLAPFDINLEGTIIVRLISLISKVLEIIEESTFNESYISHIKNESKQNPKSISYYDALDYISSSPYLISSSNSSIRLSKVDEIHSMMHDIINNPINKFSLTKNISTRDFSSQNSFGNVVVNNIYNEFSNPLSIANPLPKFYIQDLQLSDIKLNFSFNPFISIEHSAFAEETLLRSAITALLMAMGSIVAKVDNCPIRFSAYKDSFIFTSVNGLGDNIAANYLSQVYRQIFFLLFSSEILGNPVRLFMMVGEGIQDFLTLPFRGLLESPLGFFIGMFRGTTSLFKTLVASLCTTAGNFSSSLQVGLIALGAVDSYPYLIENKSSLASKNQGSLSFGLDTHNLDHNNFPSSIKKKTQTMRPNSLVEGFKYGLLGLFLDPFNGFRLDGVKGLLIGIVKGLIGTIGRPLFGALGMSSSLMNTISFWLMPRYLANQKLRLVRSRPPRYFHNPNMPLQIYSIEENLGLDILSRVSKGYFKDETYLFHCRLSDKTILLITKTRFLCLYETMDDIQIVWNCPLINILSAELGHEVKSALKLLDARTNLNEAHDNSLRVSIQEAAPSLHIYHTPLSTQKRGTPSIKDNTTGGLRLSHIQVEFESHTHFARVLRLLLAMSPSVKSSDIVIYLKTIDLMTSSGSNKSFQDKIISKNQQIQELIFTTPTK